MKKLIAMLLALVMVLGLVACGASEPAATEAPKAETKEETPAAPEAPAASEEAGSVYYLNFKPEFDEPCRLWPRPTPRRPAWKSRSLPPLPAPTPTP